MPLKGAVVTNLFTYINNAAAPNAVLPFLETAKMIPFLPHSFILYPLNTIAASPGCLSNNSPLSSRERKVFPNYVQSGQVHSNLFLQSYNSRAGFTKPCALLKLDFLTSAYKKCMR